MRPARTKFRHLFANYRKSTPPCRPAKSPRHVTQVVGRRPVACRKSPAAQTPSRPYRLVRGVVVDEPDTPEHAQEMNGRLHVYLPLLPSEAVEVVVEYPSRHRRDPGSEPMDFLQGLLHLGGRRVLPDGVGVSAEPLPDQSGGVRQRPGALLCAVPGAHRQAVQQPDQLRLAHGCQPRWIQKTLPIDLHRNPPRLLPRHAPIESHGDQKRERIPSNEAFGFRVQRAPVRIIGTGLAEFLEPLHNRLWFHRLMLAPSGS